VKFEKNQKPPEIFKHFKIHVIMLLKQKRRDNMNKTTIAAEELYNTSKEIGLAETLYGVFGNRVSVSIPFSKKDCDTNIEEIEFSVRAMHSLKRAGAFTVGAVIDLIANEGLLQIRNLGKKTAVEIKVRIMEFGYERLTEKEKQAFFIEVVKRNCV
jgi:DNA-directed RNA polymerase alpha subunit